MLLAAMACSEDNRVSRYLCSRTRVADQLLNGRLGTTPLDQAGAIPC